MKTRFLKFNLFNSYNNCKVVGKCMVALMVMSMSVGCSDQTDYLDEHIAENSNTLRANSDKRTYQEALKVAMGAINNFNNDGSTRGNNDGKKLDLSKGVKYITTSSTNLRRSASNQLDTLMYVFNFEDGQGYVIISACKHTPAMLAFADEGFYDPSLPQENKGFERLMDNAKQYVNNSFQSPSRYLGPLTPIDREPEYILLSSVRNLIPVTWGQTGVEGVYCPNGIAGCANTASAMLMSFYEYPTSISLQHDDYVNSNYNLDWSLMKRHNRDHQYGHNYEQFLSPEDSIAAHDMISHLCRQLGVNSYSNYSTYETGTTTGGLLSSMYAMGYNTTGEIDYTQDNLVSILDSQHPVYMTGFTNSWGGHAWLVDGYKYYRIFDPMAIYFDENGNIVNGETTYCYYNHVNWGWDGENSGYFLSNCFDTSAGFSYDYAERISGGYNFTTELKMFNFYPNI